MENDVLNNVMDVTDLNGMTTTDVTATTCGGRSFDVKSAAIGFAAGIGVCFVAGKIKQKRLAKIEAQKTQKTEAAPAAANNTVQTEFEEVEQK